MAAAARHPAGCHVAVHHKEGKKRVNSALQFAQKAAQGESEVASNHLVLAKLYEDQEKIPEAIQALKTAVRVDPTLASPHYRLHRLFARIGDQKAALEALAEFQSLSRLYGS